MHIEIAVERSDATDIDARAIRIDGIQIKNVPDELESEFVDSSRAQHMIFTKHPRLIVNGRVICTRRCHLAADVTETGRDTVLRVVR